MEIAEKSQRIDAWSKKEDLILVETILENMLLGNTLQLAYEKASKNLTNNTVSRTKGACAFRWVKYLKSSHHEKYEQAKKEGSSHKKAVQLAPIDYTNSRNNKPFVNKSTSAFKEYIHENNFATTPFIVKLQLHIEEYLSLKKQIEEDSQTISILKKELLNLQSLLDESMSNTNEDLLVDLRDELQILKEENQEYKNILDVMERARETRKRSISRVSEIREDQQDKATG